jgi:ParB family chromosome partitioning protein
LKSKGKNLSLTSYDDIFQTEEAKIEASQEKVIEIPLSELHPFKNHPFKVKELV